MCIIKPALFRNLPCCSIQISSKLCQYFILGMSLIDNVANVLTDIANARIQFSCQNWFLFQLNIIPHMYVVTFEIYFQFCHKTEDSVKYNNHDPTLIHQQTWSNFSSNQVYAYFYGCFVYYLINHAFQVSWKLINIWIKEIIHDIMPICF